MPLQSWTNSFVLLTLTMIAESTAFISTLDAQFAPTFATPADPSTVSTASVAHAKPRHLARAPPVSSSTTTTAPATSASNVPGPPAYTPMNYTYDPITANLQQSLPTTAGSISFYPCTLYRIPNVPGQALPVSVCECDSSTFDLSHAPVGATSTMCGYTEKPTSTLDVPAATTTQIINPAATPAGSGLVDIYAADWCNATGCTLGTRPMMGMVRDAEFTCDWLSSEKGAGMFMLDEHDTPTNRMTDQKAMEDLGFGIVNAQHYCNLSDVLFTRQSDHSFLATDQVDGRASRCVANATWPGTGERAQKCDTGQQNFMDVTFHYQCVGALCDANSTAILPAPGSSSVTISQSTTSASTSMSSSAPADTATEVSSSVPASQEASLSPSSSAPPLSTSAPLPSSSTPPAASSTTSGTLPPPASDTQTSRSLISCDVPNVYTGSVCASTVKTAVCVCSGSTFAQSLSAVGTAGETEPCAYTVIPTSTVSLQLAPCSSVTSKVFSALSSSAPPAVPSSTMISSADVPASAPLAASGSSSGSASLMSSTSSSSPSLSSSSSTVAPAPTTGPATATTTTSANTCTSGQIPATPTGEGRFYVYTVPWQDGGRTVGCPDNSVTMIGFIKARAANCGWFEATHDPDGFYHFHYDVDGLWANWRCDSTGPYSAMPNFDIQNKHRVCYVGDLNFREQCDGTFFVTSNDTDAHAVCKKDCEWPETQSEFEDCKKAPQFPRPKCLLDCTGDICLPPETSTSSTTVAASTGDATMGVAAANPTSATSTTSPAAESSCALPGAYGDKSLRLLAFVPDDKDSRYFTFDYDQKPDAIPGCDAYKYLALQGPGLPEVEWTAPPFGFSLTTMIGTKLCERDMTVKLNQGCDGESYIVTREYDGREIASCKAMTPPLVNKKCKMQDAGHTDYTMAALMSCTGDLCGSGVSPPSRRWDFIGDFPTSAIAVNISEYPRHSDDTDAATTLNVDDAQGDGDARRGGAASSTFTDAFDVLSAETLA